MKVRGGIVRLSDGQSQPLAEKHNQHRMTAVVQLSTLVSKPYPRVVCLRW